VLTADTVHIKTMLVLEARHLLVMKNERKRKFVLTAFTKACT